MCQNCVPFLQDLLLQNQNQAEKINSGLIETLLVIITGVTIVTLIIVLALVVSKILVKNQQKNKTDIIPMYHLQNGHATATITTSSDTHRTGSDSIRTLSTMVADSQPSRIPSEDRVPSSSAQSGYDNPVMLVPSPPTSANRRNRLPPLS